MPKPIDLLAAIRPETLSGVRDLLVLNPRHDVHVPSPNDYLVFSRAVPDIRG